MKKMNFARLFNEVNTTGNDVCTIVSSERSINNSYLDSEVDDINLGKLKSGYKDEGKLIGLEGNRRIGSDIIIGDFFLFVAVMRKET